VCVKKFGDAMTNELTVLLNLGKLVLSALVGFLANMDAAFVQHVRMPFIVFPHIDIMPRLGLQLDCVNLPGAHCDVNMFGFRLGGLQLQHTPRHTIDLLLLMLFAVILMAKCD
jgi:hypothetical protein